MRTTIRIDDDLLMKLKERARKENVSLTRVLERTLRAGLEAPAKPLSRKLRYRERTFKMGLPRINLDKALALAAELENAEVLREMSLRK